MTAADRGWGPGWPVNRTKDMRLILAAGIQLSVHKQIAPLVEWLVGETDRRGYRLRRGECWGYANRAIRGGTSASNHSWGLAVDLNAPANPQGRKLVTDMPAWMPALWSVWGFRWGGSYKPPTLYDAMHYEFLGTPAEASRLVLKLANLEPPKPAPTPMEVPPMINPPVEIDGKVVAVLKAPNGGVWQLTDKGAVYAWECVDRGAPNRHPDYWGSRRAARLEPLGDGYTVVASTGERYEYP